MLNDTSRDRKFIEEYFPIEEVGNEAAKEKSIRHGHPSTLHIWWARRPLSSSRAACYSSLIPKPITLEKLETKKQFIIELSKWKNSLNQKVIKQANHDIINTFQGKKPKVLDPYAGGGAIPLEALRLGCDVHAIDYNPVAVLIEKCTLEYPQKYGERLLLDVTTMGRWILEEVKEELEKFYPPIIITHNQKKYKSTPVAYIWSRTIKCTNCQIEIPLLKQYWLARKYNKKISLFPIHESKNGSNQVSFKIVGTGYDEFPDIFNPKNATVNRSQVICPSCQAKSEPNDVKERFKNGFASQKLVAIVVCSDRLKGKFYVLASDMDQKSFDLVEEELEKKRMKLMDNWGIDPFPTEFLSLEDKGITFAIQRFGIHYWYQLFNSRQLFAFMTFCEKIREVYKKLGNLNLDRDYIKAVISYLGLALDRVMSYNTKFGRWHVTGEKATDLFAIQNIGWVWDYCETNPSSDNFSWKTNLDWIIRFLKHAVEIRSSPARVQQGTATNLKMYKDSYFDAVFTDPPYYDNIIYSNLSDFFYVLLKRSIGFLFPSLFLKEELTPKKDEVVANIRRHKSKESAKTFFSNRLTKSFREISRVLKSNGIVVIVYTHKSIDGWESFIKALLNSQLYVSAAWPVLTEMRGRLKAYTSSVLKSSLYIVIRKKRTIQEISFPDFKHELTNHLNSKLKLISKEGISGIDFSIAAIGLSLEVICKYKRILKEGQGVEVANLIVEVNRIVNQYSEMKEIQ